MKRFLLFAFLMLLSKPSSAQSYRSTVNSGNDAYKQKQYDAAAKKYDEAAKKDPERMESYYNRGNVAYRNEDV